MNLPENQYNIYQASHVENTYASGIDSVGKKEKDVETFNFPKYREVILSVGGKNIFSELTNSQNIHLVLDEETSLEIKTSYKNIIEVKGSNLFSLLSNSFTIGGTKGVIPSGQFALQGTQIWESTDVISFSLELKLYMTTSGYNDVLRPSLELAKWAVPSKKQSKNKILGNSLIPPGPNLADILQQLGVEVNSEKSFLGISLSDSKGVLNVQIGKHLQIDNVVITSVVPTYSAALDEDYAPVKCSLAVSFQTLEVATTDMIEGILQKFNAK
jgi:hypothetical protein